VEEGAAGAGQFGWRFRLAEGSGGGRARKFAWIDAFRKPAELAPRPWGSRDRRGGAGPARPS
jgi:hypothetical protein